MACIKINLRDPHLAVMFVTHLALDARKAQKNQILSMAVEMASNFGHQSPSCRSKIFGCGCRLQGSAYGPTLDSILKTQHAQK